MDSGFDQGAIVESQIGFKTILFVVRIRRIRVDSVSPMLLGVSNTSDENL